MQVQKGWELIWRGGAVPLAQLVSPASQLLVRKTSRYSHSPRGLSKPHFPHHILTLCIAIMSDTTTRPSSQQNKSSCWSDRHLRTVPQKSGSPVIYSLNDTQGKRHGKYGVLSSCGLDTLPPAVGEIWKRGGPAVPNSDLCISPAKGSRPGRQYSTRISGPGSVSSTSTCSCGSPSPQDFRYASSGHPDPLRSNPYECPPSSLFSSKQ